MKKTIDDFLNNEEMIFEFFKESYKKIKENYGDDELYLYYRSNFLIYARTLIHKVLNKKIHSNIVKEANDILHNTSSIFSIAPKLTYNGKTNKTYRTDFGVINEAYKDICKQVSYKIWKNIAKVNDQKKN